MHDTHVFDLPSTAPMCWNRFALCKRDTHVSALPDPMCRQCFALCRRDTHVPALPLTYVRGHCGQRFALCSRDMHVLTLPHTYVRADRGSALRFADVTQTCRPAPHVRYVLAVLRPEQATHARVRLAPHLCAGRTSLCRRDTHVFVLPSNAPMCWNRFAPCRRDTHVSALPLTYVRAVLCALQA